MPASSPPDQRPPEWAVVLTTYNAAEAHIVAGRLQSEGIHAWVHQEPFGSAMGFTVGPLGEVRVVVDSRDYDRAVAILSTPPPPVLPEDVDQIIYPGDAEAIDEDALDDE